MPFDVEVDDGTLVSSLCKLRAKNEGFHLVAAGLESSFCASRHMRRPEILGYGRFDLPFQFCTTCLIDLAKMASAVLEKKITELHEAAAKQGDVVRSLKASAKDGKAEKASWGRWLGWALGQEGRQNMQSTLDPAQLLALCCACRRTWMLRSPSFRRSSWSWTARRR
jgi:hypothetical protein